MKRHGFVWCAHCGNPHGLDCAVCPTTGQRLDRGLNRVEAPAHELLGTCIDNRYRILRVLGSGGNGVVFEAENIAMRRLVAVKVGRAKNNWEVSERLSREARMIASLQHPNICDIYDFGWLPEHGPYLVTERLFGETLAARRATRRVMPVLEVIDLCSQMLCGLDAAHQRHLVHRDLKPSNVFIVDRVNCDPLVKIMDFGLAKDLCADPARSLTWQGQVVGTPRYMSPEQLLGSQLTHRSDLFAVGVIAYELLAGVHPFGSRGRDISSSIVADDPPPLTAHRRDASVALERVIACALRKDPWARIQNAISFQRALLSCASVYREPSDDCMVADSSAG